MSLELFTEIGLSKQKAEETLKNTSLSKVLADVISEAKLHHIKQLSEPPIGTLLYHIATRLKSQCHKFIPLLVKYVCNGGIKNEAQFCEALEFLLHNISSNFTEEEFVSTAGVGKEVSPDDIEQCVENVVQKYKESIVAQRYTFNFGKLLAEIKKELKWADGKMVKNELDLQVLGLLGPKTVEDLEKATSKKAKKPVENGQKIDDLKKPNQNGPKKTEAETDGAESIQDLMKLKVNLHKPGENYKTDGYVVTPKTMDLLQKHLKDTGGKVITRFPPEPNGILHIGHAKAININFGYSKVHGGLCNLRYDDTNPEKEEEKYFRGIKDMVEWLGYKPAKITYSSDSFDQLYEWAKELIRKNLAYVCHQRAEDLKGFNPAPSPWRDRPVKESLQLFEDMKNGKFDEGEATLRMKVKLEEGKVDPVAYRIKFVAHHRTKNKWCIYPTYDYTHCLCDSIENISHSLCTKEFQSRRSSYYWLCNALDLYCPVQWEYGRLNMYYAVVSKRKITRLIQEKIVRDWDDPRLFTLTALRRRGFPPEAINKFVAKMGVTTMQGVVHPQVLEAVVRDLLNVTAPRAMAVLYPIEVNIVNVSPSASKTVDVPNFPSEPSKGCHTVPISSKIFIERDDFREHGEKGYKRLTLTQPCGLKHVGYVISVQKVHKDPNGTVTSLDVRYEEVSEKNKPKGFIHWVSDPLTCEVRLYDRLFLHQSPENEAEVKGGYLTDVNKDSLTVIENAYVDKSVSGAKIYDRFQFERIGFFSVDTDSSSRKLIFNRTVNLKEDAQKS